MPAINQQYCQTRYNVTYSRGRTISYIVIHYTATTASAANNCQYFGRGNRGASADFFVDKDGGICQFNGDINNYYTWHCGDGHGAYGITNANSVGIENVSAGEDFTSAQISSLSSLVQMLMSQYNVAADHVVRHYDASRKRCPAPYIDQSKWRTLWQQITSGTGDPITTTPGGTQVSGTPGGTLSLSYDRSTDALVTEFGYAKEVGEDEANMGKGLKAQEESAKYKVSAINMADLLNDIFDIWGFSVSGGGTTTSPSGGQQVAGQAKTQSGQVITSGTWLPLPSSQPQTGIIANYTGYIRNWAQGTTQRTIYDLWNSSGRPSQHTIAMLDGYYLIAPGRYFSNNAGDMLEVRLVNGTKFMCMVGDTKGSDTPNEYGHLFGGAVDVIEWESICSAQSQLAQGLRDWGIYGVNVEGMVNYGTYFR